MCCPWHNKFHIKIPYHFNSVSLWTIVKSLQECSECSKFHMVYSVLRFASENSKIPAKENKIWHCIMKIQSWSVSKVNTKKILDTFHSGFYIKKSGFTIGSWDSSVSIVTRLWTVQPGNDPLRGRIFFLPQRPDQLWAPSSLLSNGYRCKSAGAWN
jgi:hypothetical protein